MDSYFKNLEKIEFVVTMACTGKCKHCSEGGHDGFSGHVDADVAAEAIKKICAHYNIKTVMTFGGEPLLYPDVVCTIHKTASDLGIEKRQLITNGYFSIFEPLVKQAVSLEVASQSNEEALRLHLERTIKNVGKVEADGSQTAEGFVVFKGSHISPVDDDTIPAVVKDRRRAVKIDENNILLEDELFSSPSYAAMFVIGKSENGLTRWKTADGKSIKSLEAEQGTD